MRNFLRLEIENNENQIVLQYKALGFLVPVCPDPDALLNTKASRARVPGIK